MFMVLDAICVERFVDSESFLPGRSKQLETPFGRCRMLLCCLPMKDTDVLAH